MTQKKKTTAFHPPANPTLISTGAITPDMNVALEKMRRLSGPAQIVKEQLDNAVATLLASAILQMAEQNRSQTNT